MNGLIILKDTANTGCVVPSDALTSISVADGSVVANFSVIDDGDTPTIDSITFTVDGTVADAEHKVARGFADLCKSDRTIVLDDVNGDYAGLADVDGVAFSLNGADSLPSSRVFGSRTVDASLTLGDTDSGKIITLNKATGLTVTLPDATAARVGQKYIIEVKTDLTSGNYVIACDSGDTFRGHVVILGSAALHDLAASSDATFTMNGTTQGGDIGTRIVCEIVEAGKVLISGFAAGSGTAQTAFS